MPVRMTESYYSEIERELSEYFYELYWKDILELLKEPIYNASPKSALIAAIRSGKVHYSAGVFTGTFNITISKELSKFATYDGRAKVWRGYPPADIVSAAAVANDRGRKLAEAIERKIQEIPSRVEGMVGDFQYSIGTPLERMNAEAGKDLAGLGISIDMTPELSSRLIEEYTTNQNLNIVNWTGDQVSRLREMIEKNALSGYNRQELENLIKAEYGVTQNKARFLARNETSLFTAKVRDQRYQEAGVNRYKWSSSHDQRVRHLHNELNGQVFSYDSPPIIDERTGIRGSPGEIWNCRCTAIPVL